MDWLNIPIPGGEAELLNEIRMKNMKPISVIMFCCGLLICNNALSNDQIADKRVNKINIHNPGYESEFRLHNFVTWGYKVEVKMWGRFTGLGSTYLSNERAYYVQLVPALETHIRYYHNLLKRKENNRNVSYNSGNYFAAGLYAAQAVINMIEKNSNPPSELMYGPFGGYGIRRALSDRIIFDGNCRMQLNNSKSISFKPMIVLGLTLGYRL